MTLSKKQKRKRVRQPRVKRMKRPARLQAAKKWLSKYEGKNVVRGYRKHFGVDWRCAAIELERLGVKLDPVYLKQLEVTEQEKMRRKEETEAESDLAELADHADMIEMIFGKFHEIYLHDPGMEAILYPNLEPEETDMEAVMGPEDDWMPAVLPRCLPEIDFPPYTYVPGETPHPVGDPKGHMFGSQAESLSVSPEPWHRCEEYLRGIDLFNHGYYWESHEAWEAVWHGVGRSGRIADLLKGLIKLAAAGVKTRVGSPTGRQRHCRRAAEVFQRAGRGEEDGRGSTTMLMGLSLESLAGWAAEAERDIPWITSPGRYPPRVFSFVLLPTS